MAHNDTFHMGYYRTFHAIAEGLYIRQLAHYLRQYIALCSQYWMNCTTRHAPYRDMAAIASPALLFHTICMDFILALPLSGPNHYNSILTVTDKFSKGKILILGQNDATAKKWAIELLNYLRLCNWEIPKATITDCDPKFWSELWKELFKQLGVDLLVSTAYHLQTDRLSECTNQTVEIALRYPITSNPGVAWHKSLPTLQLALMNLLIETTGSTLNQILYGQST